MITLTLFNGETRQVPKGTTLLPLAQEFAKDFSTSIVEGVFNGETIDLQGLNFGKELRLRNIHPTGFHYMSVVLVHKAGFFVFIIRLN
ncbi:MAG: hypothetical protein IJ947_03445 [Phascolarctobacterium sp.]|nr:hypothetical protein [Phascolarctobacterium sp.]